MKTTTELKSMREKDFENLQSHCECGYEFAFYMSYCPYCGTRRSYELKKDQKKEESK